MKELGDTYPLINIEEVSATGGKFKKIITKTFYSKSTFYISQFMLGWDYVGRYKQ